MTGVSPLQLPCVRRDAQEVNKPGLKGPEKEAYRHLPLTTSRREGKGRAERLQRNGVLRDYLLVRPAEYLFLALVNRSTTHVGLRGWAQTVGETRRRGGRGAVEGTAQKD